MPQGFQRLYLFLSCQTSELGLPDEYYLIEETMSPVALTVMGDLLVEVTGVE